MIARHSFIGNGMGLTVLSGCVTSHFYVPNAPLTPSALIWHLARRSLTGLVAHSAPLATAKMITPTRHRLPTTPSTPALPNATYPHPNTTKPLPPPQPLPTPHQYPVAPTVRRRPPQPPPRLPLRKSTQQPNKCAEHVLNGIVNGANVYPWPGSQVQYGEIGVAGRRL
jgi:hypothetical protein